MWPGRAREVCKQHNAFHDSPPDDGYITVDDSWPIFNEQGMPQIPKYKVTCSLCEGPIIAVTGHRPQGLGVEEPFRNHWHDRLTALATAVFLREKPAFVITGMALGWDIAVAHACAVAGIPYIAAIPFAGQESRWASQHQALYRELVASAHRVFTISEGSYERAKMSIRNQWMMDRATMAVALFNGKKGGTWNAVHYAAGSMRVVNVWVSWRKHRYD